MRGLAVFVVAVLLPLCVVGEEDLPHPEVIWNSPASEHASTSRWRCTSFAEDVIEFRFYPSLSEEIDLWVIRQGEAFTYAIGFKQGLETHFYLEPDGTHEIRIGADRVARYFAFSGKEGEMLPPSAMWFGCKESR